jgi:hypothetical protein
MRWARTARTDKQRAIFAQMARTWLEAAGRSEETLGLLDEHRETRPIK